MEREKLKLTPAQAREIVWEGDQNFETVEDNIVSKNRWSIIHYIVVKRLSDGKFFIDEYQVGATECQEELAYENTIPNFTEVFPTQKTITVYT